jgi:3-deoxy-D-manno-octulosonate 8-phosphate phosphatase (KDO 8-P phosphatase)
MPTAQVSRQGQVTSRKARARLLKLAVFDVDGVMTDGRIYLSDSGEEMKAFHVLDGHGLKRLREQGIEIAILSGRRARCVERRAAELGITLVVQGASEKLPAFRALLRELKLQTEQSAFMGDDVVDLPVLEVCGLAITVPHAPQIVKRACQYVTRTGGGQGAVREACELIIRLRDGKSRP